MDNEDAKWIEESVEKPVIEMPEAPGSIHIDSYLKGFHVGWTKRLVDNKLGKELFNIKAFIKGLKDEGFKPSWNEQTNESIAPTPQDCPHLHKEAKVSSGFKKPENKGKIYESCLDCKKFIGWKNE